MDYKYIEQLTERYFECETTLQEEQILKAFFAQTEQELPGQLRQYQPIFAAMEPSGELDASFDERMLALTAGAGDARTAPVKARTISLGQRLQPLFHAAAILAIIITLGSAMNISLRQEAPATGDDINYAAYKDTYDDPAMAYDKMEDALRLISTGFSMAEMADSMQRDTLYGNLR